MFLDDIETWLDLCLEIALPLHEPLHSTLRIGYYYWHIRTARRIVGNLQQARVREALLHSGKRIHAKVNRGFEHEQDAYAVGLGPDLNLHVVEAAQLL